MIHLVFMQPTNYSSNIPLYVISGHATPFTSHIPL